MSAVFCIYTPLFSSSYIILKKNSKCQIILSINILVSLKYKDSQKVNTNIISVNIKSLNLQVIIYFYSSHFELESKLGPPIAFFFLFKSLFNFKSPLHSFFPPSFSPSPSPPSPPSSLLLLIKLYW